MFTRDNMSRMWSQFGNAFMKFFSHQQAVAKLHLVNYKRRWVAVFFATWPPLILALAFSVGAEIYVLATQYSQTYSFNQYSGPNLSFIHVKDSSEFGNKFDKALRQIAVSDTGSSSNFADMEDLNSTIREIEERENDTNNVMNVGFVYAVNNQSYCTSNTTSGTQALVNISFLYNSSSDLDFSPLAYNAIWKVITNDSNAELKMTNYYSQSGMSLGGTESLLAFILVPIALVLINVIFVNELVGEIRTERMKFMKSCGLNMWAYWITTFIIDFCLYTLVWLIIFLVCYFLKVTIFYNFGAFLFFNLELSGIAAILFAYIISFTFESSKLGSTVFYIIIGLIPMGFYAIFLGYLSDKWTSGFSFVMGALPTSDVAEMLFNMYNITSNSVNVTTSQFLSLNLNNKQLLATQFIRVPVYILIMVFIEFKLRAKNPKGISGSLGEHDAEFLEFKSRQNVTQEAKAFEQSIASASPSEYAIKVNNVSKMFFDSIGKPVMAVNHVSLGVKEGSCFGFLGANGAGKTTLMRIITKQEALSAGSVQINGNDIYGNFNQKDLSICPQFDDHLPPNLTPRETLYVFTKIHRIPPPRSHELVEELISTLGIESEKKNSELSGGNRRKLSVALSFIGEAKIVLLDEPTSSLDPISRNMVHNLINMYKGRKTYMLCTHLLGEAEDLCDNISIMIKGCVYAVGSPQFLSKQFGREWKVELGLESDESVIKGKVDGFFAEQLPQAEKTIDHQLSRIYTVPSTSIPMPDLFEKLENAHSMDIGIKTFTCSCSTLEKVFLEICQLAEQSKKEETDKSNIAESKGEEKAGKL